MCDESLEKAAAKFSYQTLTAADSIRLLLLQPRAASQADEIYCLLQHTTLSECEDDLTFQYVALSYVWGDEADQRRIFVNGAEFHVTANLFYALLSIRHEMKELPLWVDAICIDQKNLKERGQQVSFMGSIYAWARNTIIYLGESDEGSDRAIQALRYASSRDFSNAEDIRKCIVSSILSRPWFTRVWVLQELALSQNPIIQCGLSRAKWDRLASFIAVVNELVDHSPSVQEPTSVRGPARPEAEQLMMGMQEAREKIQVGNINRRLVETYQTLLSLVRSRSGLGAKDPRDLIYAHVGMINYVAVDRLDFRARGRVASQISSSAQSVSVGSRAPAAISYEKTLQVTSCWTTQEVTIDYAKTVAQVYNEFAQRAIEASQDLSIATYTQETHPQSRLPGLASWAPDWTKRQYQQNVPLSDASSVPYARGGFGGFKLSRSPHFFVSENSVLGVDIRFLAIKDIGKLRFDRQRPEHAIMLYRRIYESWQTKLGPDVLPPLAEQKLSDYHERGQQEKSLKWGASLKLDRILWALGRPDPSLSTQSLALADYIVKSSTGNGSKTIVHGRRIALLENGTSAIVPAYAEKGDVVGATSVRGDNKGDRTTIVLRSHQNPEDSALESKLRSGLSGGLIAETVAEIRRRSQPIRHYTLVGDCFVELTSIGPLWAEDVIAAIH
ncbi:Heterokaryon incompatibility protein 6 OR allele [Lachnellula suecica]|uniref:Heterokaryon incompatibility protein 6 OR allele n=1 Tax=Lachnellula suecica TaxID=602035 RepID=A0A8T9BXU4_9HELO|nr:Heterokaryon incompatibility protein 6 OR allele [Lachnellula suecica]